MIKTVNLNDEVTCWSKEKENCLHHICSLSSSPKVRFVKWKCGYVSSHTHDIDLCPPFQVFQRKWKTVLNSIIFYCWRGMILFFKPISSHLLCFPRPVWKWLTGEPTTHLGIRRGRSQERVLLSSTAVDQLPVNPHSFWAAFAWS